MTRLAIATTSFWGSSIGKKIIVAITGVIMALFLLAHMSGNLLVFVGRDAMNDYAEWLRHLLHGAGLWISRLVLLAALAAHVVATVQLTRENRAARVSRYEFPDTVVASRSSRIMIWSGLTILAFVIFHILHYTVRIDEDLANLTEKTAEGVVRHDVYGMVVVGFQNVWVSLFYILSISLLCSHLSHGVASMFQTVGLRTDKTKGAITGLSWGYSILIWAGFLIVPVAILLGIVTFESSPAAPAH